MAAVIVHGGAYPVPDSIADDCIAGCRAAAEDGYKALTAGKSALDAGTLKLFYATFKNKVD